MSKSFQDLVAFQRSLEVVVDVYEVTTHFPKHETYGLVAQLRRASIGVISSIGEGQGRLSHGEWRQSLSHARGSLFEVEAQLIAGQRLGFVSNASLQQITLKIRRAGWALSGLIRWVRNAERVSKSKVSLPRSNPAATPQ